MATPTDPALDVRAVSKRFGGVHALVDVDLRLRRGEILGLVGENGSGKSTLVKVLSGYHTPERGATGEVFGRSLSFPVNNPGELGIAVIHQDLALVDEMTVIENLGVSSSYGSSGLRPVRWRRERSRSVELLERFGVDVDPGARVGDLAPAERASVAIVRATRELSSHAHRHILILDEPTSYLTGAEAQRVMRVMRTVAESGSSVIFISHHLHEVVEVADRVVVLRDGRAVADVDAATTTEARIIAHMLGRELGDFYPARLDPAGSRDVAMVAEHVTGEIVDDLSFELRHGEILGVTGLAGMGQQELPYLLTGVQAPAAGVARRGDGRVLGRSPAATLRAGVVLVPGNRQRDGVWLDATAAENISLPVLREYYRRAWLNGREESTRAKGLMQMFRVQPPIADQKVSNFSGGNQQKIVLAKWLQGEPDVLLLDEPTQGVDAGARKEILEIVRAATEAGAAVAIFSSDLEQLANVCTRVLVLWRGRAAAELVGDEITEDSLLQACQGESSLVA
ncbi:MAG: sugar ABC transporter ATP-binding protein [bacterium]|nr:sugar ABC transporter ATP-binding protein [bacterium]